jgi:hypothetical protein
MKLERKHEHFNITVSLHLLFIGFGTYWVLMSMCLMTLSLMIFRLMKQSSDRTAISLKIPKLMSNSIMKLIIISHGRMTLCITTCSLIILSLKIFSKKLFSLMTALSLKILSIMSVSIMTLCLMILSLLILSPLTLSMALSLKTLSIM